MWQVLFATVSAVSLHESLCYPPMAPVLYYGKRYDTRFSSADRLLQSMIDSDRPQLFSIKRSRANDREIMKAYKHYLDSVNEENNDDNDAVYTEGFVAPLSDASSDADDSDSNEIEFAEPPRGLVVQGRPTKRAGRYPFIRLRRKMQLPALIERLTNAIGGPSSETNSKFVRFAVKGKRGRIAEGQEEEFYE